VAQVFPRYTNTLSRVTAVAVFALVATLLWLWSRIQSSPYTSTVRIAKTQPVPFSHKHHAGNIGIDCRYCHTSVEESAFAGIPPTETCMNCHRQIWSDSPMLEPVRESYRAGKPLVWTRVHDLPDFVYFNHSVHIKRGVGCVSCHGQVDNMPLTWQVGDLTMSWCLDCHRHPERALRPREAVFDMSWAPAGDQEELGREIAAAEGVKTLESCSYCHR
jgi:cytochrome c7-like protein/class III cytochrome C family protein